MLPFYKIHHKAGSSCVCVCVVGEERSTEIILVFQNEVLQSKGKAKMQ